MEVGLTSVEVDADLGTFQRGEGRLLRPGLFFAQSVCGTHIFVWIFKVVGEILYSHNSVKLVVVFGNLQVVERRVERKYVCGWGWLSRIWPGEGAKGEEVIECGREEVLQCMVLVTEGWNQTLCACKTAHSLTCVGARFSIEALLTVLDGGPHLAEIPVEVEKMVELKSMALIPVGGVCASRIMDHLETGQE